MKIDAIVSLLSKLTIRDRDSGRPFKFVLNDNQRKAVQLLKEERENKGLPLWYIVLKARRVGMSSLTEGLMLGHILSQPMAHAKILAHLDNSVEQLFKVPLSLSNEIRKKISSAIFRDPTQTRIVAVHEDGDSDLQIATAGSTQGGRGEGISALHLSEAALYRSPESFTALLSAVPYSKDTLLCIESTANGKSGIGEPFYKLWNASVKRETEFLPIFLSWLDDPTFVRPAHEAIDAPVDQTEKDLIKFFNASKEQLAWRRWCIINRCSGYTDTFLQEYPATPEEAFITSGNPAFIREELAAARASVKAGQSIEWVREGQEVKFRPGGNGTLLFWGEKPDPTHSFYLGVDAARGVEGGDFAAICVINGTTAEVVARFADRITPVTLAMLVNSLGRYYNRAMVNVELTGGWGDWAQTILRDKFNYPNFYRWKGLDDKAIAPKARNSIGWMTTYRSREKIFTAFREALREQGLQVRDEQIVIQMEQAERVNTRWDIKKGHDDILFSSLLANIAMQHYPPSKRLWSASPMKESDPAEAQERFKYKDSFQVEPEHSGVLIKAMMDAHLKELKLGEKRKASRPALEGI